MLVGRIVNLGLAAFAVCRSAHYLHNYMVRGEESQLVFFAMMGVLTLFFVSDEIARQVRK